MMKKLMGTRDRLLMILASAGDVFLDMYIKGMSVSRRSSLLEILEIKNSNFRSALSRYLKTGEVEKIVDKKGRACLRLGPSGQERITRVFPLYRLSFKPWDKKWRVVIFDIPEKERGKRDVLRKKLISLGFGKLQESIYITPLDVLYDIKEWLKEKGLFGQVLVLEAKEMFVHDPKVIVNLVWNLDKLNNEYFEILKSADFLGKEDKEKKEELKKRLFELILRDPFLSREFLPDDWVGDEARKAVMSLF